MASLASILTDISLAEGLTLDQIDVTGVTGVVPGFSVSNASSGADIIAQLQSAFFFKVFKSNGKITFRSPQTTVVAALELDHLLPLSGGGYLQKVKGENRALPRSLAVQYIDKTADYQQGSQYAMRQIYDTGSNDTLTLAIVLDANKAMQVAQTTLYKKWVNVDTYQWNLAIKFIILEIGDIVTIQEPDYIHRIEIIKKTIDNNVINFQGQLDAYDTLTQGVSGGTISVTTPTVFNPTDTILQLLDIPTLRAQDDNFGYYVAAARSNTSWKGCIIYDSPDDVTYTQIGVINAPSIMGSTTTALGVGPHGFMDNGNSVTVTIGIDGQLTSTTLIDILDSGNSCIIGNEILQFQTATLIAANTYKLSNLLRGRLGTEWAIGTHAIGDRFVMLTPGGNLIRIIDNHANWNDSRYIKAVSLGQNIADVTAVSFTNTGVSSKPLSSSYVRGIVDGSQNWNLSWLRRTRYNGTLQDNVTDVPLNEDSEQYTLNIMSGSTIVRQVLIDVNNFQYTLAMQTADFGSFQTTLTIKVAQNSALVGAGYYSSRTFTL